jgi:hypothetical protein
MSTTDDAAIRLEQQKPMVTLLEQMQPTLTAKDAALCLEPEKPTSTPEAPALDPTRLWVLIADWSNLVAGLLLSTAFFLGALIFDRGVTSISPATPSWFQFCFCAEGVLYAIGCFFMIPIMANAQNAFGSMQFAILTIGGIFFSFSGLVVPTCIQTVQDAFLHEPCILTDAGWPGTPKVWNAFAHYGITCFMVGTAMGQSGVMSLPRDKIVSPFWGVTFYTLGAYTIGVFKFWGPVLVGGVAATWPWWMGLLGAIFLTTGALIFGIMDGSFVLRRDRLPSTQDAAEAGVQLESLA